MALFEPPGHRPPSRRQAAIFFAKTTLLRLRRLLFEWRTRPRRHLRGGELGTVPVVAESRSLLWGNDAAGEFALTAGKVQNLRTACRALDGVEVAAGETFSFWRQLGWPSFARGFVTGRELREGCVVPSTGGGLCQLSGQLYGVALEAGLPIVERHAHTRVLPGSLAETGRDATVFWPYVDLRFVADDPLRIEAELTATELLVRIRRRRGEAASAVANAVAADQLNSEPARGSADGDCVTCAVTSCFRNPAALAAHGAGEGHVAFLLDARWPEFDDWCDRLSRAGDRWFTPLDGRFWRKPNYAWQNPDRVGRENATWLTLREAWAHRRLPVQGAVRQRALLQRDERLARRYAKRLSPLARHLVVSQNLLPHLWRAGVLGGRTFDVLANRWPLEELQRRLDEAAAKHRESPTLADFRADPALVRAESAALKSAARVVTPHRAIAAHFGARAIQLEWVMPTATERVDLTPAAHPWVLFPASPLARKGVFELAEALRGLDVSVRILGAASEGHLDPLAGIDWSRAIDAKLAGAMALVLPAYVEHQPRLALRALAEGAPVVATRACGLPAHPNLWEIPTPDAAAIRTALLSIRGVEARSDRSIRGDGIRNHPIEQLRAR